MKAWRKYQEDVATYFCSIGLDASTDQALEGVRTNHNIDVLVKSQYVGFDVTWLVECKHWKSPVNKLHVLALREIVADTGADRGILLSESGFQSGAIDAANLTSVQVTSLATLKENARESTFSMRLRDLFDQVESCRERYWDIPKSRRIEHGLKPDWPSDGFHGAQILEVCSDILARAFRGTYPFRSDHMLAYIMFDGEKYFTSPEDVVQTVQLYLGDLQRKISLCEREGLSAEKSAT